MTVARYLGRPVHPERYNCWHLVMDWYRCEEGVVLHDLNPGTRSIETIRAAYEAHIQEFEPVGDPERGDIVYIEWRRMPQHVGIYIGGPRRLVLHAAGDMVRCQPLNDVICGSLHHAFYRPSK